MAEHFVTLFDSAFLPFGIMLHASLRRHCPDSHLWVVAMDEETGRLLALLGLPGLTVIHLSSVETDEILQVKPGRSRGEYCWTLTPFTFDAVLSRDPSIERVTYVDADLYFIADPGILIDEFTASGREVLITEHSYAPEYRVFERLSGRFCVQFLTVKRSPGAAEVIGWWQTRCLEWCFARNEPGRFGDQMYLDQWPRLFPERIHILARTEATLAPWNCRHLLDLEGIPLAKVVFYHCHAARLVAPGRLRLWDGYRVGSGVRELYRGLVVEFGRALQLAWAAGWKTAYLPTSATWRNHIREVYRRLGRRVGYAAVPSPPGPVA